MKRALLVTLFILVPGEPVAAQTVVPCGQATYVTYASGRIAGVDWVDDRRAQVHSRSELTQSMVVDTTMTVGSDGSTPHASTIVTMAGSPPNPPVVRDIGGSTIFWSDSVPSSVQVAITRARVISRPSAQIQATSLFSSLRGNIDVRRVDEDDWIVAYHNKHYLVLTDDKGCMLAASLPDNGVVIERRPNFSASDFPLWPPYAAPPDRAYAERDIGISAPQGYRLAGTLTVPWRASKLVPAAVLITGLSPHERNNGTPPWMPFRDVADALARAGFAVLRVDDRGVGASTGDNAKLTTFGKADDVRTQIRWLRSQPNIDQKRIMLVGYSEGGLIAPMIAASDPSIAAVVTMGGPGVSGWDLARYQITAAVSGDPTVAPKNRAKAIAAQLAAPLNAHERSYVSIDPLRYARRVRCPALIVQGSTDLIVPQRSAERIANAMRAGGNHDVTVRFFPNVSHAFLPDTNGLNAEWAYVPSALTSPDVLETITRWARAHFEHET